MESLLFQDPNFIYLVVIAAIWMAVTAAYVPGTGLVEGIAAALAVGSLLMLANVATNWFAALLVLVGGVMFLVVPFLEERYRLIALGGLGLQVLGSLFLFNGLYVSPVLIIAIALLSLAYYRFVLIPLLNTHHQSAALRTDRPLIGEYGRVQSALNPAGMVRVQGESWSARLSEDSPAPVPVDATVVVLDQEGLTLIVAPEHPKRKQQPVVEEE
jgi:membrane-bound ClpP family serine protease